MMSQWGHYILSGVCAFFDGKLWHILYVLHIVANEGNDDLIWSWNQQLVGRRKLVRCETHIRTVHVGLLGLQYFYYLWSNLFLCFSQADTGIGQSPLLFSQEISSSLKKPGVVVPSMSAPVFCPSSRSVDTKSPMRPWDSLHHAGQIQVLFRNLTPLATNGAVRWVTFDAEGITIQQGIPVRRQISWEAENLSKDVGVQTRTILVGGGFLTILKNMKGQWEGLSHILWKNKFETTSQNMYNVIVEV